MEALELYKEEMRKMEEHKYACENAGKQVETLSNNPTFKTLLLQLHCCFLFYKCGVWRE